jgi:hypothetical protein
VEKTKSVLSGTWDADEKALKDQKTFADMLRRAGETQIGGTWKLKRAHGNWWLRPRR